MALDLSKIQVNTACYSVSQIVSMIEENQIDLIYAREDGFRWSAFAKCSFIESLLLGIPTPSLYLLEDVNFQLRVVDGLERLQTLYEFIHEKTLKLGHTKYLNVAGKRFDDLSIGLKGRISHASVTAHIIDRQTPYEIKDYIFLKIREGQPWSSERYARTLGPEPTRNNP